MNFGKALLGFFSYRAYVSLKIDSPNLTKKSSGLLKDWWSISLISLIFTIHGRTQASIEAIFWQSDGYDSEIKSVAESQVIVK